MQIELARIAQQQQELKQLNQQLEKRSQKFNAQFVPLTLSQFKLFKIKKASQTGNIKYLQGMLLNDIQDLRQRKNKIKQRTNKFFQSIQVESDPNKYFAEKVIPDFSEDNLTIRNNTWYLFGVDYMSNQMIRNYFIVNPHFKIQWINDSSCNIIYNSAQQAQQAIKPFKKGDSMTDQNDQIWYELQQYQIQGVKRKLFCRLATNRDQKKQTNHGHNSKYYRWVINKQKINNFVKHTARKEIGKTKPISKSRPIKKVQEEDQDSSSGISLSQEKPIE